MSNNTALIKNLSKKISFYYIRWCILSDDYSVAQALWKVEPQLNQGLLRIYIDV